LFGINQWDSALWTFWTSQAKGDFCHVRRQCS
jgi:hypothetical protein